MRPLRAQVSLLCCQGTSGRASERASQPARERKDKESRGKREERGERAPHETHKKADPRSLSKRREGGRTARVATPRDGSAFSVVGPWIASPGRSTQHEPGRVRMGRVGTGRAGRRGAGLRPRFGPRGSTAGRAMGRGLRLGRRAQQLPPLLPLIRNEIRIIYIMSYVLCIIYCIIYYRAQKTSTSSLAESLMSRGEACAFGVRVPLELSSCKLKKQIKKVNWRCTWPWFDEQTKLRSIYTMVSVRSKRLRSNSVL